MSIMGSGPRLKPKAGITTQISQMGGRMPITRSIRARTNRAGLKSQNSLWNLGTLRKEGDMLKADYLPG